MKSTKRFVALLMAVVMVFALSAVALAAGGVFGNLPAAGTSTIEPITGFYIPKGIYVKNNTLTSVPLPKVTFNFKIEAVLQGDEALQYGAHAAGVQVFPGKPGALFGADRNDSASSVQVKSHAEDEDVYYTDLTFYARPVNGVNADEGAHVEEPLYFGTSMTPFANETKPGVYRYRVTDITPAAYLENVGISRGPNYDPVAYVDLYVQISNDNGNPVPSIASIVVSEKEDKVPERNENGTITIVNTTNPDDIQELDPKNVVVTKDGTVWILKPGATEPYVFPTSYQIKEGYKVPESKMVPGLVKTEDVFNDEPEGKFVDTDYDGKPDDSDDNKVPDNLTGTEVLKDDEGNIIGIDGKTYPADEYIVDPTTGEILHDSDGDGAKDDPVGPGENHVYAGRIKLFEYDVDVYETFNVCLKKLITGPMGDKTHKFPFVADVTNKTAEAGDDAQALEYWYQEGKGDAKSSTGNPSPHSFKLSDKNVFFVRGLNANALLNFTETNDTSFPFAVTVVGRNGEIYRSADPMAKGESKSAYQGSQTVATATSGVFAANPLQYTIMTNEQSSINPTGVVLRFAPYILMLGAACFFVALSRRRREQENA
jgi:hypothetical protein